MRGQVLNISTQCKASLRNYHGLQYHRAFGHAGFYVTEAEAEAVQM